MEYECLLDHSILSSTYRSQGWQKRSSCSGFGWSSISQDKNIISLLQKQVINKNPSVIFGFVKLIILSYYRLKKHIKRYKIINRLRIQFISMLTRYQSDSVII